MADTAGIDRDNNPSAGLPDFSYPTGVVLFPAPFTGIQVDDQVSCNLYPGKTFSCTSVSTYKDYAGTVWVSVYLAGFNWPSGSTRQTSATFSRAASSRSVQDNYVVAQAVTPGDNDHPVNVLPLKFVTGLVPGDVLSFLPTPTRTQGGSFTVADIDPVYNDVITADPISIPLQVNDPLVWDQQTEGQMVFQGFHDIIIKANNIAPTDLSRFQAMVAPDPVLTWIAPKVSLGDSDLIYCPHDLVPNLSGIDIATANGAMISGTPETSWTGADTYVAHVDWTRQLTAAPASLMTDQSATLAPNAWPTNRNGALQNLPNWNLSDIQTAWSGTALQTLVHDYSGQRRILTTWNGSSVTVTAFTWTGSAWSAGTALGWSGAPPNCGIPFPPVPSSLGTGSAILYLDNSGCLRLMFGASAASLALTAAQQGGLLVQTPFGAYLVTANGYGLITWTGSALALNWQPLTTAGIWLLPTTFCALDTHNCYCLAVVQTWDSSSAKYTYAVWVYHLAAVPIAPTTAAPAVAVTASISGSAALLNVTAASGQIRQNMLVSTGNLQVPPSLYVVAQASGEPGGSGIYNLSQATVDVPSGPMALSFGGPYPSVLEDPELISSSIPSVIKAVKDPTSARIFGLIGSRMFQISKVSSGIVERLCVDGLSVQQLVENLAMIQNAYVCPLPDGVLHIVSRNLQETPTDLAVQVLSSKIYMASEYFISQVNVAGATDDVYAEQAGPLGGLTLEIDSQLLTTRSQCRAVAASYLRFFGSGKKCREDEWTWTGTGAAPWESLLPGQTVTINGGAAKYYVVGLDYSLMECKATVKLLEV